MRTTIFSRAKLLGATVTLVSFVAGLSGAYALGEKIAQKKKTKGATALSLFVTSRLNVSSLTPKQISEMQAHVKPQPIYLGQLKAFVENELKTNGRVLVVCTPFNGICLQVDEQKTEKIFQKLADKLTRTINDSQSRGGN